LQFWWFLPQTILAELFQKEWHTSAIMTSAYLLPNGIAGGAVIVLNGYLPKAFTLKQRIIVGSAGATIGALLLAFASEKHWYWPLIFPGLIVGSASMALVYVSSNVALILSVPAEHSGVAGGVFNSSLQLGTSIGLSIATAIQVSYPSATSTPEAITPSWKGYQSSLFFSVACTAVVIVLTLLFFRDPLAAPIEGSAGEELVEAAAADESPDAAPSAAVVAKA
jgi:MFS family permease